MGLFQHKDPDYLSPFTPPEVAEVSDFHENMLLWIGAYERLFAPTKQAKPIFEDARRAVKEMTDAELSTSLRNGWTYEMQTVFLLKRCLVKELPYMKSAAGKKEFYEINKKLMTRATEIRLATKGQAREEDREMRSRLL